MADDDTHPLDADTRRFVVHFVGRAVITAAVRVTARTYHEAARAAWDSMMAGQHELFPRALEAGSVGISMVLDLSDLNQPGMAPDDQVRRYTPPAGTRAAEKRRSRRPPKG